MRDSLKMFLTYFLLFFGFLSITCWAGASIEHRYYGHAEMKEHGFTEFKQCHEYADLNNPYDLSDCFRERYITWLDQTTDSYFQKLTPAARGERLDMLKFFRGTAADPFVMLHFENGNVKNTDKVFILGHGLSDSPYFYKDIAQVIYRMGFNVVAFRFTGHGRADRHLQYADYQDWLKDMKTAAELALESGYGNQVVLGGFSMGGGAVAYHLARPGTKYTLAKEKVAGALLISPALETPTRRARIRGHCVQTLVSSARATESLIEGAGIFTSLQSSPKDGLNMRYRFIHARAICQLANMNYRMTDDQNSSALLSGEQKEAIDIPIFAAISDNDGAVTRENLEDFLLQRNGDYRYVFFSQSPQEDRQRLEAMAKRGEGDIDVVPVNFEDGHTQLLLDGSDLYDGSDGVFNCDKTLGEKTKTPYTYTREVNCRFDRLSYQLRRWIRDQFLPATHRVGRVAPPLGHDFHIQN